MIIATAPWISSAAHGVAQRGWMLPRNEKIRPSRAIAYGTRVLASKLPLSAPNTLVMIASMMTAPPAGSALGALNLRANTSVCRARTVDRLVEGQGPSAGGDMAPAYTSPTQRISSVSVAG